MKGPGIVLAWGVRSTVAALKEIECKSSGAMWYSIVAVTDPNCGRISFFLQATDECTN